MIVGGELKRKAKQPLTFVVYGAMTKAHREFLQELRQLLRKHGYGGRLVSTVTKAQPQRRRRKS